MARTALVATMMAGFALLGGAGRMAAQKAGQAVAVHPGAAVGAAAVEPVIACEVSPATFTPGETVTVTTRVLRGGGGSLRLRYGSSAGRFAGAPEGGSARLNTAGVANGTIHVTCTAETANGRVVTATATTTAVAGMASHPPLPEPHSPGKQPDLLANHDMPHVGIGDGSGQKTQESHEAHPPSEGSVVAAQPVPRRDAGGVAQAAPHSDQPHQQPGQGQLQPHGGGMQQPGHPAGQQAGQDGVAAAPHVPKYGAGGGGGIAAGAAAPGAGVAVGAGAGVAAGPHGQGHGDPYREMEGLDAWVGRLKKGAIQYDIPQTMFVPVARTVSVTIHGYGDTGGVVAGGGPVMAVKVSPKMKVQLLSGGVADEFEIQADDADDVKDIPIHGSATWHWTVKPKRPGVDQVLLVQTMLVYEHSGRNPVLVEQNPLKIRVQILGFWQMLQYLFWNDPVGLLKYMAPGGAGFAFVAGVVAWWWKRRRPEDRAARRGKTRGRAAATGHG